MQVKNSSSNLFRRAAFDFVRTCTGTRFRVHFLKMSFWLLPDLCSGGHDPELKVGQAGLAAVEAVSSLVHGHRFFACWRRSVGKGPSWLFVHRGPSNDPLQPCRKCDVDWTGSVRTDDLISTKF
jgi:hypothetical protein